MGTEKLLNACELCGDQVNKDQQIVNYTGKVVCFGCARHIAKMFVERAR